MDTSRRRSGIPGSDTILWLSDGFGDSVTGLPADAVTVPGLSAVWLAANACLMQSHQPTPEGDPMVIHGGGGVADYGNWIGSVLMLD
ncbi:MAG: hypothetical protein KA211_00395 [Xylophilus sp.]|nr:hypothetical protein [Xylophilus sp.]